MALYTVHLACRMGNREPSEPWSNLCLLIANTDLHHVSCGKVVQFGKESLILVLVFKSNKN
jgi:hypothetical protein